MKIHKRFLVFFLFLSLVTRAQYPFEKHKEIEYLEVKKWITTGINKDSLAMKREILIPGFQNKNAALRIQQTISYTLPDSTEYSIVKIYRKDQLVKQFEVQTLSINDPLPVFVGDIDGNGLNDLKIIFPNYGCGNYNVYCQTAFVFQNKDLSFTEFVYTDMFENFENRPERDFNNDGNYEIITQSFQNYAKHNYWLFNIYNYSKGKLVNVNHLANYPIMIPLDSYTVSKKIPREKMKQFEIKIPKI
jgi:hypothetical protein